MVQDTSQNSRASNPSVVLLSHSPVGQLRTRGSAAGAVPFEPEQNVEARARDLLGDALRHEHAALRGNAGAHFRQDGVEAFGPERAAVDRVVVGWVAAVPLLAVADLVYVASGGWISSKRISSLFGKELKAL